LKVNCFCSLHSVSHVGCATTPRAGVNEYLDERTGQGNGGSGALIFALERSTLAAHARLHQPDGRRGDRSGQHSCASWLFLVDDRSANRLRHFAAGRQILRCLPMVGSFG
jgi:hypothetical protein